MDYRYTVVMSVFGVLTSAETVQIIWKKNQVILEYYTIMDFLLSKYGLIFTEFDSIDRGGAEVNNFKFSKYQTIFTE